MTRSAESGKPGVRSFLAGAAAGALGMYFLDPDSARRRRALVRDQLTRAARRSRDAADVTRRDVANRARGMAARTRSWLAPDAASDPVVAERVRAVLGQWVSHPGAIVVEVQGGVVDLSGAVLRDEVESLRRTVRRVRGVQGLDDRLEVHDTADIPTLQGGTPRTGPRNELFQARSSPAARLLLAAASLAAIATALGVAAERRQAS